MARHGDGGDVDGGRARAGKIVHDDIDGADAGAGADGVVCQVVVSKRRMRGRRGGRWRRLGEMLEFGEEGRVLGGVRDDDDGVAVVGTADPAVDTGEEGRRAEHLSVHGGGAPTVRLADVAERGEIRSLIAGTETAMEGGVGGHVGGEGDVGFGDGGGHGAREVADGGVEAVGEFGDGGDVVVLALVAGVTHCAWGGGETVGTGAGGAEFGAHLVGIRIVARAAVLEVGRADTTPGGRGGAVAEVGLGAAEMGALSGEGGGMWDVAYFGGSDKQRFPSGFEFSCCFFSLQSPLRFRMMEGRCITIRRQLLSIGRFLVRRLLRCRLIKVLALVQGPLFWCFPPIGRPFPSSRASSLTRTSA